MLYSLSLMFMILSCAKEKVVEHPYAGLSSEYFESFSDKTMKAQKFILEAADEVFDEVFDKAVKACKKVEPDCEIG